MAEITKIQWSGATWNPWWGCNKVSPGCAHCYAERLMRGWGKDFDIVKRTSDKTFYAPLKWHDPQKVFSCSMGDFFHEVADPWRDEAWDIVRRTPHLTYQILTKRPERIADHLPADWGHGYPNVWLGTSVESQRWTARAADLLDIPAAVHFLSCEPLLGPLNLDPYIWGNVGPRLDWVIIGGESGPQARLMRPEWARSLVDHCQQAGVAVFVKQLGEVLARQGMCKDRAGGNISEWPADLQVREFPRVAAATLF